MTFSNVALTLISLVIALGVEHLLEHISLLTQLGLLLLSAGGGIANHIGDLDAIDATIPVSLMAVVQLSGAWSLFQWWRAA